MAIRATGCLLSQFSWTNRVGFLQKNLQEIRIALTEPSGINSDIQHKWITTLEGIENLTEYREGSDIESESKDINGLRTLAGEVRAQFRDKIGVPDKNS